ncbi:XRE family transcriptional regulator [Pseudoalteromonas gelatinilytica]|uniref:Repressor n=1 Tax=Pseudoalteromonas gelatinilytica TaxID=1703256 RepID=A0ABQ1TSU1_9GAMM|nr:S24 family peptidase [Pseudoalteromonas profundi]GGF00718.1 repressor [Pseudoalteromonas profundi]
MTTYLRDERNRLGLTQQQAAEAIGVGKTTLLRWESGYPIPSDKLIALSDIGFDVTYVLKGVNTPSAVLEPTKTDLIAVPQYDLAASAGGGALVIAEHPIARFELSKRWLEQHNLHNKKLTVVPVRGDSMEQTLYDGDLTLVSLVDDLADAREGVCVLRFDDEIFVKRIQYDFKSKGYKVTSDNTAYSSFFVEVNDIESGRFTVLGRVERVLQRTKV